MDASAVAVVALGVAVVVQAALLVVVIALHERVTSALRADAARLQNLVIAREPREFVALQRASAPKPPAAPTEPEPSLIGA